MTPDELIQKQLGLALLALNRIAAFSDSGANERLKITGKYSWFDEPGSVQTARKVLKEIEYLDDRFAALAALKEFHRIGGTPLEELELNDEPEFDRPEHHETDGTLE